MRRHRIALFLIPAAALVVIVPLIFHGCSCGHDFDFHLVSWMEAAAQFRAGVLYPAWAFSPAWNAGEPRFVFYPPVSWTLGALLGMVMPWGSVPIVYTWLALVASGFSMYYLARELAGDGADGSGPILAAVVYLANPYMIFTAYERTAYAELLAAAWIPLLLAAILRQRVTVLRIAAPVALLWLTNAPAAVMSCYALALLTAIRLASTWRSQGKDSSLEGRSACLTLAGRVAAGTVLGLALAAFYILPAAYERRWVQIAMATIAGMRIEDNFLFCRTGDGLHDEVLHTASIVAVVMLAAALVVFATIALQSRRECNAHTAVFVKPWHRAFPLAMLAVVIAVLLTPMSAAFWRVAPEMTFLQFPWRLTAILAAVVCAGVGLPASHLTLEKPALVSASLAVAIAMSYPAVSAFTQQCDPEDIVAARLATFTAHTGTDPTDEYTPVQADNDALAHAHPPFWLAADDQAEAGQRQTAVGQTSMHFAIDAPLAETLVLNLRDYPAWEVRRDGAVIDERIERPDGLIAFSVPLGRSRINISYRTMPDRHIGEAISGVAFCGVLAWMGIRLRRTPSRIIEG